MTGRGEAEGTRALSLFFRRRLLGLLPPRIACLPSYMVAPPFHFLFLVAELFGFHYIILLFPSFLPVLYHLFLLISLFRLPSPRSPVFPPSPSFMFPIRTDSQNSASFLRHFARGSTHTCEPIAPFGTYLL